MWIKQLEWLKWFCELRPPPFSHLTLTSSEMLKNVNASVPCPLFSVMQHSVWLEGSCRPFTNKPLKCYGTEHCWMHVFVWMHVYVKHCLWYSTERTLFGHMGAVFTNQKWLNLFSELSLIHVKFLHTLFKSVLFKFTQHQVKSTTLVKDKCVFMLVLFENKGFSKQFRTNRGFDQYRKAAQNR